MSIYTLFETTPPFYTLFATKPRKLSVSLSKRSDQKPTISIRSYIRATPSQPSPAIPKCTTTKTVTMPHGLGNQPNELPTHEQQFCTLDQRESRPQWPVNPRIPESKSFRAGSTGTVRPLCKSGPGTGIHRGNDWTGEAGM